MAHTDGTTPRKPSTHQCCLLCGSSSKRLHSLSQNKAIQDNYRSNLETFLDVQLEEHLIPFVFMCESCAKKCSSSVSFKAEALENYKTYIASMYRFKRQAKTPPSQLKQKSKSIAEQIQKSVEKFQKLNIADSSHVVAHKSCRRSLLSDTGNISKRDVNVSEHSYSAPETKTVSSSPELTSAAKEAVTCGGKFVYEFCQLSVITDQLKKLCQPGASILWHREPNVLMTDHIFANAVNELHAKCPMLLAVLNACIGDKIGAESKVATVGTIYAMMMHSRNKQFSAVQRLYTSLAIQFHADNKGNTIQNEWFLQLAGLNNVYLHTDDSARLWMLLERLNKVHITLSDESKRHVMNNFAAYSSEQIIKECSEGRGNCKINGDNVDIYLRTNDVRMDNKNKDLHFFASDVTFDRVSVDNLDDKAPIKNLDLVNYKMFLASEEELKLYKESIKILLARLLAEHMKAFEWMKPVVPSHIPHDLEDIMSKKSSIHWLPLQLKNEMHLDQCVEIMQQLERQVNNIYCKAGRAGELEDLYIPVGGDQLTRVNLQSAKNLRAGCHTQEERLHHLNPVIVELFHTIMDFLEKLFKKFYKSANSRDVGTLAHLKLVIQRTNVNGQVKSRFEAHEDFALITGLAYFLVFAMKVFNMKDLDDKPKHHLLKENMKYFQTKAKEKLFHDIMDEIVSQCWMPFEEDTSKSPNTVNLQVTSGEDTTDLETTVTDGLVQLMIQIQGANYKVSIPFENTKGGCMLDIKMAKGNTSVLVKNIEKVDVVDDLNSYAFNFMQWYLLLLNFQDIIKEGDIYRTNVILKILIPFFYSHSCLSKYFTECIDYTLKTEVMLSQKLSMRVRAASFVNPKGGKGHNKAADMQKENQVKVLKDLIRGLGSNKNENAIVTVSKAAPVINSITKNFDNMLEVKDKGTRHRKREIKGDLNLLLNCLTKLNPWTECQGRQLQGFSQITKSPFNFNRDLLKIHIMDRVNRLKRGAPDLGEISSDSEDL